MPDPVRHATVVVLLAALTACGADEDREVMKPEETVFRDLVTAPAKAEDRTNAAMDAHREALQRQVAEGEGAPPAGRED